MLLAEDLRFFHLGPYNLQVQASQTVTIHGRSGTGKTLLLRSLADLDPHEGRISLNGTDQESVPACTWRYHVGYLANHYSFWFETVSAHFDNSPEDTSPEHTPIEHYLDLLNLGTSILRSPVNRLSSGEKQRLSLIRLVLNSPDALLLDEPTSHLDPDTVLATERLIADYQSRKNCPVLWVSHDPGQRERVAARQLLMENGVLREITA